jgi:hypothetical protein
MGKKSSSPIIALLSLSLLLAFSGCVRAGDPVEPRVVEAVRGDVIELGRKMGLAFQDLDFTGFRGFFSQSSRPMEKMYYLMNSPLDDMAEVTIVIRPLRVTSRDGADVLLGFRMRNTAGETRHEIEAAFRAKRESGRWRLGEEIGLAEAQGVFELTDARVHVSFDLPKHTMSVRAELQGRRTGAAGGSLALALGPYFTVDALSADGIQVTYVKAGEHLLVDLPPDVSEFTIRLAYHGEVDSPGNHLVSEDETYVRMEAGWIPAIEGSRARSRITVEAPKGQQPIATGELVAREDGDGVTTFTFDTLWLAEIPTLAMCPYAAKTRKVGDVELAAYLTPQHADKADAYLDLAARIIEFYTARFGPYPYHRYSIVECSFVGGYGPLSFCLISNRTFDAAEPPIDFLAHEMSHVWWGGVVGTQGVESFLTEPLATYSAYLFQELAWTEQEARVYRQWLLAQYLLAREGAGLDAPVATATGEAGWGIRHGMNYCKGALALHQLRRRVGRDTFLSILATLAADYAHKNGGWPEFRAAAEKATGMDLGAFFAQWIERAATPNFAISAPPSYDAGGRVLTLALEQHEPPCAFTLPVRIETEGGAVVDAQVEVKEAAETFEIACPDLPRRVILDPDDQVLKVLAAPDIPVGSANALTQAGQAHVIYAAGADPSETDALRGIAEQIADRAPSREATDVKAESDIAEPELDKANVILVTTSLEGAAFGHLFGWTPVEIGDDGITWSGVRYGDAGHAAIVSARNPRRPELLIALYVGNSIDALRSIAGKNPGNANLTIFSSGSEVLSADFPRVASGHWYEFEPR